MPPRVDHNRKMPAHSGRGPHAAPLTFMPRRIHCLPLRMRDRLAALALCLVASTAVRAVRRRLPGRARGLRQGRSRQARCRGGEAQRARAGALRGLLAIEARPRRSVAGGHSQLSRPLSQHAARGSVARGLVEVPRPPGTLGPFRARLRPAAQRRRRRSRLRHGALQVAARRRCRAGRWPAVVVHRQHHPRYLRAGVRRLAHPRHDQLHRPANAHAAGKRSQQCARRAGHRQRVPGQGPPHRA